MTLSPLRDYINADPLSRPGKAAGFECSEHFGDRQLLSAHRKPLGSANTWTVWIILSEPSGCKGIPEGDTSAGCKQA